MNKSRNLLLLVVLILIIVGLALFSWQNWSPNLSLTFLGLRSIPLPLSLWILGAFLAGVITYLLIYGIFGLSNYLLKKNLQPARPRSRKSHHQDRTEEVWDASQPQVSSDSQSSFNLNKDSEPAKKNENYDDWQPRPPRVNRSWDGTTEEQGSEEIQESVNESGTKNYETEQQPKTGSSSGSVYSYGYRDSSNSGVGQTESVYDADYRIITPPPPANTSIPTQEEEDEQVSDKDNKSEE
ncbi:MAG: LapA family protein [Okeania sp. SIO3C4]|nr:LapA family protein [Okeania sp. SIO3C4]